MKILEIQILNKLIEWWKSLKTITQRIITFTSLLILAAIQFIPVPDFFHPGHNIPIFIYTMLGVIALILGGLLVGGLWVLACHIIKEKEK